MGTQTIDEAKLGAFMERALGDAADLMAATLATLGDRLDLFKALADRPATSDELSARELRGASLMRIARLDPAVNPSVATRGARASAARLKSAGDKGPRTIAAAAAQYLQSTT